MPRLANQRQNEMRTLCVRWVRKNRPDVLKRIRSQVDRKLPLTALAAKRKG